MHTYIATQSSLLKDSVKNSTRIIFLHVKERDFFRCSRNDTFSTRLAFAWSWVLQFHSMKSSSLWRTLYLAASRQALWNSSTNFFLCLGGISEVAVGVGGGVTAMMDVRVCMEAVISALCWKRTGGGVENHFRNWKNDYLSHNSVIFHILLFMVSSMPT